MTTVAQVLLTAASQNGVTEGPGNNEVKFNDWFYGHHVVGAQYEWCAVYVSWVFAECGYVGIHTASAAGMETQPGLTWHAGSTDGAKPGDVFVYNFNGQHHTGILTEVHDGYFLVWEGNTELTQDTDGGHVMLRHRDQGSYILGYGRPNYLGEEVQDLTDAEHNQLQEIRNIVGNLQAVATRDIDTLSPLIEQVLAAVKADANSGSGAGDVDPKAFVSALRDALVTGTK